jgi:hypothetical protein
MKIIPESIFQLGFEAHTTADIRKRENTVLWPADLIDG